MSNWIYVFFLELIARISPELRESLKKLLDDLDAKAKETASPLDDIFVKFLKAIFLFNAK